MLLLAGSAVAPCGASYAARRFPAACLGSPTLVVAPGPTAQRSRHRDGRDQPGQPPPLLAELQEISLTGPKTINARPGRWQSHVKRELPVCHLSVRMKISGIWKQSHVQSVGDMRKLKSPSQSPRRPILHNATRQVLIAGVSRRDLSLSSARSYARCQN